MIFFKKKVDEIEIPLFSEKKGKILNNDLLHVESSQDARNFYLLLFATMLE